MSIPAKRPFPASSAAFGVKTSAAWLVGPAAGIKRKHPRISDPDDSDSGAEAWREITDSDTSSAIGEAAAAASTNGLTVFALGSKAAVEEYGLEKKKRNQALMKVRILSLREGLAMLPLILHYHSVPRQQDPDNPTSSTSRTSPITPTSPTTHPGNDETDAPIDPNSRFLHRATLPVLHITPGDFLHDFIKPADPARKKLITHQLHLPAADGYDALIGMLSFQSRAHLNGAVHNPTLGDIEDLLQHIQSLGNTAAAEEFGWCDPKPPAAHAVASDASSRQHPPRTPPTSQTKDKATRNMRVFLGIMQRLMDPWLGTSPIEVLPRTTPIKDKVVKYWKWRGKGRDLSAEVAGWEWRYAKEKRLEVFREAVADGVVPGMDMMDNKAEKTEVTALKTQVEVMQQQQEVMQQQQEATNKQLAFLTSLLMSGVVPIPPALPLPTAPTRAPLVETDKENMGN